MDILHSREKEGRDNAGAVARKDKIWQMQVSRINPKNSNTHYASHWLSLASVVS